MSKILTGERQEAFYQLRNVFTVAQVNALTRYIDARLEELKAIRTSPGTGGEQG